MQFRKNPIRPFISMPRYLSGIANAAAWASILLIAISTCPAQQDHPADAAPPAGNQQSPAQTSTPANPHPDPQTQSSSAQPKQPIPDATNGDHKKQIADDSSHLLTMAIALKAEVDKTNKDTLSVAVIRKADEIEKLARSVKEKTKTSAGAN
jgi:hypothetical protein